MIAKIILLQNVEVGLLAAQPNWDTEVKVKLDIPTDVTKEPITLKESRRNFAQSARYSMQWRSYLANSADTEALRIFLSRIRGEPVAVPLWPDMCSVQEPFNIAPGDVQIRLNDLPVRFGSVWIIANSDFSNFEIVTVSSLNIGSKTLRLSVGARKAWTATTTTLYPLIFGRIVDRPSPQAITDECCEVDLNVKENVDFSLRLSTQAGTLPIVGSHIPSFQLLNLFNIEPNFAQPTDWTEQPDIIYELVGFLRNEQQRVYDHRNARGQDFEYFQNNRTDIAFIERFWRTMRGPVLPFMVPTWKGDMRMRTNTPVSSHPTWINVEDSEFCDVGRETQPGDQFIALIDANNTIDPRRLTSAVGSPLGQMHLIASTNMSAHTAASTLLCHLLLARFQDATLEWSYTTPYLGSTRIKFVELPAEYAATPIPLPEPAYLFIFTEVGVRVDKFTSYENTIQIPSGIYVGSYVPAPFSFDGLSNGLRLDQEKLDFKSFRFTGNPLNKMWPFALDGILTLDVIEVNAANPQSSTAILRFHGDVTTVNSDYKATAIAFGNFFDRAVPRFLLSVSDNYVQFSPPTQLPASAFKITSTAASVNHTLQTLTIQSATAHGKAVDYFAGGWLETGAGNNKEKRGILHSAPATGTNVTLHIDRPLLKAANGASIDLYPGYDGSIDQCETKFNNRINFGGHPYIPNINPTVKAMKPKTVQGGKK